MATGSSWRRRAVLAGALVSVVYGVAVWTFLRLLRDLSEEE